MEFRCFVRDLPPTRAMNKQSRFIRSVQIYFFGVWLVVVCLALPLLALRCLLWWVQDIKFCIQLDSFYELVKPLK